MSADPSEAVPLRAAPDPMSVLGNLDKRREEIIAAQELTLAVPRWTNPIIKVVYKPVDHSIIRRGQDGADGKKGGKRSAAEMDANKDVLIAGCVGVYALIEGEKYSLNDADFEGDWTLFDADLARNLKCDPTARGAVKGLYIYDGDIIAAANAIAEFSGYKEQEADEELAGES